jgi:hypothetical protein
MSWDRSNRNNPCVTSAVVVGVAGMRVRVPVVV